MVCHLKAPICHLYRNIWCFRADFTNAFSILGNWRKTRQGNAFPVHNLLDVVLSFLRFPLTYDVTSVPWPTPEPPLADFVVAFGATGDEDSGSEDEGPILPPRMAYELLCAASYIGDQMHGYNRIDDVPVLIPRIARQYMRRSRTWCKSFRECYIRLELRLRKGLMPTPNCTGEEMALHTMFDHIEHDESPESSHLSEDPDYLRLPACPNDEKWDDVKECCFEDFDVLELFQDEGSSQSSDDDEVEADLPETNRKLAFMCGGIGQHVFNFAHMHPSEWFHVFRTETFWADVADQPATEPRVASSRASHGADVRRDRLWTQSGIDHLKKEKCWGRWGSPTVGDTVPSDMDLASWHFFYNRGHLKAEDRVWTQRGIDQLKQENSWVKWGSPTVGDTVPKEMDCRTRHVFYNNNYLKTEALVWTRIGIDYLKKETCWGRWGSPTVGDTVPNDAHQSVRNSFQDEGYLMTESRWQSSSKGKANVMAAPRVKPKADPKVMPKTAISKSSKAVAKANAKGEAKAKAKR